MYNQISYIIPYRKSSLDREYALNFTINYINKHFPEIEVLVVEQDKEPQVLNLKGNFRLLFTYNPGLFNRSWGMNCGAEASCRPYVAFADNDVFMTPDDYRTFFERILEPEIDVVVPAGITINNTEYKRVKNVKFIEGDGFGFVDVLDERDKWTFSMMLTLFKKEKLKNCGYWFEEFQGWGAEDNAMDELITKCLNYEVLNLQLYHIDHARSALDGNMQPNYVLNNKILHQIKAYFNIDAELYLKKRHIYNKINGIADVNKYRNEDVNAKVSEIKALYNEFIKTRNHKPEKPKSLVLAITTLNRLNYLHTMLVSFLKFSDASFEWNIVIADDGSEDETKGYLEEITTFWSKLFIIENNRRGVAHQFNSIIKKIASITFDVCFKCDDDLLFAKNGWEKLYLDTIEKTSYEHLCYYYTEWRSHINFQEPEIKEGKLTSYCNPLDIQGAFFTITPSIIEKVGYMDAVNFAPRGLEHVDYSLRCARAGFNDKEYIYDALGSNDYVWLNYNENYESTVKVDELYSKFSPPEKVKLKLEIMSDEERVFIPFNESPAVYNDKYILGLAYELISDLKSEIEKQQYQTRRFHHPESSLLEESELQDYHNPQFGEIWYKRYMEVNDWYNEQYELLPLWYKRFGHIIKVVSGKRSFKSLFNQN